jgi:hypothetical protein
LLRLAHDHQVLGQGQQPFRVLGGRRRREPQCVLGEIHGIMGCASAQCRDRRGGYGAAEAGVRDPRGQREVTRPQRLVRH